MGFERNLTHLDGHVVPLKREGVTQPGQDSHKILLTLSLTPRAGFVETITGEGMPIFEGFGHGDLYIEYNVVLPNKLTPDLRKRQSLPLLLCMSDSPDADLRSSGLTSAFHPKKASGKTEL